VSAVRRAGETSMENRKASGSVGKAGGLALTCGLMIVAASTASAVTTQGGAPVAGRPVPQRSTMPAPVMQSSAPLSGVVSSLQIPQRLIRINDVPFRIGEPYLLLIDKRPRATGLVELTDVRKGMHVRYRTVVDGSETRVVELWLVEPSGGRAAEGVRR
jgi:hypothetical protein